MPTKSFVAQKRRIIEFQSLKYELVFHSKSTKSICVTELRLEEYHLERNLRSKSFALIPWLWISFGYRVREVKSLVHRCRPFLVPPSVASTLNLFEPEIDGRWGTLRGHRLVASLVGVLVRFTYLRGRFLPVVSFSFPPMTTVPKFMQIW